MILRTHSTNRWVDVMDTVLNFVGPVHNALASHHKNKIKFMKCYILRRMKARFVKNIRHIVSGTQ